MIYELYDSEKVAKMGEEMGHMGSFYTLSEALDYFEEYRHLFEGWPKIKYIEEN